MRKYRTSCLKGPRSTERTHQTQRTRSAKGRHAKAPIPSRTTRGQAQRSAITTKALALAEHARAAEEEARDQARGPEGRQTLHDRCVGAREAANQLLAAVVSQDPGFFELARDRLGQWRQATEDGPSNGGAQPTVCTERPGWTAVRGKGPGQPQLTSIWNGRTETRSGAR